MIQREARLLPFWTAAKYSFKPRSGIRDGDLQARSQNQSAKRHAGGEARPQLMRQSERTRFYSVITADQRGDVAPALFSDATLEDSKDFPCWNNLQRLLSPPAPALIRTLNRALGNLTF